MRAPDLLQMYAEERRLDHEFLRTLGLSSKQFAGTARLAIPYHDEHGQVVRTRYRSADGWRWGRGDGLLPYGLDRLAKAEPDKAVILVEGESDSHTLWSHDFLALGIPGAGTWKPEWARYVEGRTVFVWQEPDDAGRRFVLAVTRDLPHARVIDPPKGVKDASELHVLDPGSFRAAFAEAVAAARPRTSNGKKAIPNDGWLITLDQVRAEPVRWIWPGRIPLGKLTLLDGDPGLGKSTLMIDIAARITTGRQMPDGAPADCAGPAGVVFLSAEDGLADTLRPRLDAAEGDPSRVAVLRWTHGADGEKGWPSVLDVEEIERAVDHLEARMIVLDPLVAYLPGDAHRDQDVRGALGELLLMAERRGTSVVCIRHLRKSQADKALYRGGGSIGIIGAARSALLVAEDPSDPGHERRVLISLKCNVARQPPSLTYLLHTAARRMDGGEVATVVWGGQTGLTADEVLGPPETLSRCQEAREFLRAILEKGRVEVAEVNRAAKQQGIATDTLYRARKAEGVAWDREGFGKGGKVYLRLPDDRSHTSAS